ncbi:protein sorting system archaetidylserine decarboxylase [Halovivax sp.]|uniref:protein sorting system archaetidylserine decarboxylase n=1 Tax=Halovivax sp. TaxID=1935978 RepID=UPI0025C13427|nr:protein sorting system archaetidylserine decarboxylase [Halovivax sp.]
MQVAPGAWRYALVPLVAAPFALLVSVVAGVVLAALGVAVLGFFRDPDRAPPPVGIVAPADGKVSVLRREGERVRLGVFMNVWNVHVVRAPAAGTVTGVEHTPGAYKPAFSKDSDRNERVHVHLATEDTGESDGRQSVSADAPTEDVDGPNEGVHDPTEDVHDPTEGPDDPTGGPDDPSGGPDDPTEGDGRTGAIVDLEADAEGSRVEEVTLIAGAFARRITPYVEPDDAVERGDRIGHIAFGSRVDVVLSPEVSIDDVAVEPGERVHAGETVVLETGTPTLLAEDESGAGEAVDDRADVD